MEVNHIKQLGKKVVDTLKREGIVQLFKKSLVYLYRHLFQKKIDTNSPEKTFMDVLFINGCYLPHPSRYRVSHQREQLIANGIASNEVFYEQLNLDMVKNYRCFIFFRCPITETVKDFILKAKENHKTVLFDIDDLVIDTVYTDKIKYVQSMPKKEKELYDEGVDRMQSVLRMCDAAITTTERLAEELKRYVPEVYINRNTASERMVELSFEAINHKKRKEDNYIKIGYFSGSITHNDDILMILPVLERILSENENVQLHFVGELDIPLELKPFENRIVAHKFMRWEELPQYIASMDINIAPLEDTIFNEAKSENKWVEAALVKVPTIASKVGAMDRMIEHNKTGMLCSNNEEWYNSLVSLIQDTNKRKAIAERAHHYVLKHCTTIYTGFAFAQYIKSKLNPNIAFIVPSIQTSGGILVVLKHCLILKNAGYDVLLINEDRDSTDVIKGGQTLNVISRKEVDIQGSFDKAVATLWSTTFFLRVYPNIKERFYLVQNFETDFYEHGRAFKILANQTYSISVPSVNYITISKWCQEWLKVKFLKESKYAPNGIDLSIFHPGPREFEARIRILVEGNSEDYYKNVDESFRIVEKLDPNRYEVWYMSYKGEPKSWYRVDRFLHKVPYEEVPAVYSQCHILLKSSILESFSYPPLEMMATGGFVVVSPNEGNLEYLRDGENCLMYEPGNIDDAVGKIETIVSDPFLRRRLYIKGIETAQSRDWALIEKDILSLYG